MFVHPRNPAPFGGGLQPSLYKSIDSPSLKGGGYPGPQDGLFPPKGGGRGTQWRRFLSVAPIFLRMDADFSQIHRFVQGTPVVTPRGGTSTQGGVRNTPGRARGSGIPQERGQNSAQRTAHSAQRTAHSAQRTAHTTLTAGGAYIAGEWPTPSHGGGSFGAGCPSYVCMQRRSARIVQPHPRGGGGHSTSSFVKNRREGCIYVPGAKLPHKKSVGRPSADQWEGECRGRRNAPGQGFVQSNPHL